MAFKGVDHVVLRVADLDAAVANYRAILEIEPERMHSDTLKADQAFFQRIKQHPLFAILGDKAEHQHRIFVTKRQNRV